MNVGDIVYLKSDLKCKTPMTINSIEVDYDYKGNETRFASCIWTNSQKQILTRIFPIDVLQTILNEFKNKLLKIPLLMANSVYGLKVYSSLLASSWQDNEETKNEFEKDTRFVYNFKKYGKQKEQIKQIIELIAFDLECTDIVAVPAHTTEPNEMQLLFNSLHFTRNRQTPPRKYNHQNPLPNDYAESYKSNLGTLKGNRILLVDDICNTGTTLDHFAQALKAKQYEAVKFAVGLDYKLKPDKVKELIVSL